MMLLQRLAGHANTHPERVAVTGSESSLTYRELYENLVSLIARLQTLNLKCLALDLDNGPAWALLDLAAMSAGITLVPLPPFFSPAQVRHALTASGAEMVITDDVIRFKAKVPDLETDKSASIRLAGSNLSCLSLAQEEQVSLTSVLKVTFTSGTTAEPKGVMLNWDQLKPVVISLAEAVEVTADDCHLVLTPLAVLLENIAGLYVPLWCGARVALPSLKETGLLGAAGLDSKQMMQALEKYAATTAIFSPQMLQGAVSHLAASERSSPALLRFIALGGAAVSKRLLDESERLGLPVYEGYGLSETASVASLNLPGQYRKGSVGKPLPHMQVMISTEGEVLLRGNAFLGYLGEKGVEQNDGWWRTGDIGYLDDEGFLFLSGRIRHVFITAYGRNVSPEWVERELILEPAIAQVALFGEAKPWNVAVIVPAGEVDDAQIESAIQHTNQMLPDYARVGQWLRADAPFSLINGQLSGTGRIRRLAIAEHYLSRTEALYQQELVS
jgi:long-subunit acyl-CoA synthetase (AMP-forming)